MAPFDPIDFPEGPDDLNKFITALRRLVKRVNESADELDLLLESWQDYLRARRDGDAVVKAMLEGAKPLGQRPWNQVPGSVKDALRIAAPIQAVPLKVIPGLMNESPTFQVDGGEPFDLPPALSALLMILAEDLPESAPDGMVAWKSRADVARKLEKRFNRPYERHALDNLLHRLKAALWEKTEGNVNPFLVARSKDRLRFNARSRFAGKD